MTERKWTSGPWRVGKNLESVCLDGAYDRKFTKNGWAKSVAKITEPTWMSGTESFHNAHLISAAPDLYEALGMCVEEIKRMKPEPSLVAVFMSARAALEKARGEDQ